jgi:signal peptidase I
MTPYRLLPVLQCVEWASQRAAKSVHEEMKCGVRSLATVSASASLLGLLSTTSHLLFNTFHSYGSRSAFLADLSNGLSEALVPTVLGLAVAILAWWYHQYLSRELETIDLQMESAHVDLINRLVVHLERLCQADKGLRDFLTGGNRRQRSIGFSFADHPDLAREGPQLRTKRIYRNGVLQLLWPQLESGFDADSVLQVGLWVTFAYGVIGWLTYLDFGRPIAGFLVFLFFAVAAVNLREGSLGAILGLFAFFASAVAACVIPFGVTFSAICLAIAPSLLLGSLKAARFLAVTPGNFQEIRARKWKARLWPMPDILLGVSGAVAVAVVLFGTILSPHQMDADLAMEPSIHSDDWVISVNASLMGEVHRGELITFFGYGYARKTARVVGLPGDMIEVKAGKLIRNGKAVPEPYLQQPYWEVLSDFPLPSEAYPDNLRWEHEAAYGDRLQTGKAFRVPEYSCFLLNDNRHELTDSRIFGPVWIWNVAGRPVIAYHLRKSPLSLPRLIR